MPESFSLQQIADRIGKVLHVELLGEPDSLIDGLNTLSDARPGEISFLASPAYAKALATTRASAVIMHPSMKGDFTGAVILVDNPYLAYALVSGMFDRAPEARPGIHPSAVIAESAELHHSVSIAPNVVVGERVSLGANAVIGAGCSIGDDTTIGANARLAANVSIYHGVTIGDNVCIHSGAVIGADGFGFAPKAGGGWQKIHQIGGVTIGDNVEIGACTTIDRGALADTVIEDNVILDDHVMIAHNVRIGENTAMAGYAAVAGSSVIGKNCIFAGRAGTVGHITVCDGVHLNQGTVLTHSVKKPGAYSSGTQTSPVREWRKNAVRFNQLNDLAKRLSRLEKKDK